MPFDTKQEIAVKVQAPEGIKTVLVSMPTDSQWADWRRKKKIHQTDLGRRNYTIDPSKADAVDLQLFQAIRRTAEDVAPCDIDVYEAAYILGKLSECDIPERPERDGSHFTLKLKVMGRILTEHRLRVPTMKEMMEYERQRSSVVFGAYNTQEIRINLRAAGKLYDDVHQSHEGYVNDVPIIHKAEVVNALLQEIRSEQEEVDEPGE